MKRFSKYILPEGLWVLSFLVLKTGIDFDHVSQNWVSGTPGAFKLNMLISSTRKDRVEKEKKPKATIRAEFQRNLTCICTNRTIFWYKKI